jgi:hypothetical protein
MHGRPCAPLRASTVGKGEFMGAVETFLIRRSLGSLTAAATRPAGRCSSLPATVMAAN